MSFKQEHGSTNLAELAELSLNPDKIVDFSSNCCPYSLFNDIDPPIDAVIRRYPDISNSELYSSIATLCQINPSRLCVGNGASELIYAIARAFLSKGDNVLIITPTFSEYKKASELVGAHVHEQPLTTDFSFDVRATENAIKNLSPKLVFICNPNNPTGNIIDEKTLRQINKTIIHHGGLLVLDEAYLPFISNSSLTTIFDDAIILRSLTKDCAIPGLRLGYSITKDKNKALIQRQLPPWNVNALAQYYGSTIIQRYGEINQFTQQTLADSITLRNALVAKNWRVTPSNTHYFLIDVGDARSVRHRLLLDHHINVRDCTSFGLKHCIRVSSQLPHENTKLALIDFDTLF